jgi:CheY-like chemotaxis protein
MMISKTSSPQEQMLATKVRFGGVTKAMACQQECSMPHSAQIAVVMVVEDEALVRMSLSGELREQGYVVVEAADGDEAISVLNTSVMVDVLITDLRMPGTFDGQDLINWVRDHRPEIKTIVTSAHRGAYAADVSVEKPYDTKHVASVVKALLDKPSVLS